MPPQCHTKAAAASTSKQQFYDIELQDSGNSSAKGAFGGLDDMLHMTVVATASDERVFCCQWLIA